MGKIYIEERAINLAHYIIDNKDTVRGAAKKFGISKSISESIEIKGVFPSERNSFVKFGLVIK